MLAKLFFLASAVTLALGLNQDNPRQDDHARLRIAAFNMQTFGQAKMDNEFIADKLIKVSPMGYLIVLW